jgi:precorrin-2/cobalt-factor-2 C20-methyltransferase
MLLWIKKGHPGLICDQSGIFIFKLLKQVCIPMTAGTLFGIGVGPGDPELIPLKAVRLLQQVDRVFTAASTKNDYSLAVEIARPHIPQATAIETLEFPMRKDRTVMERAWRQNAQRLAKALESGHSAAFLTLGDPLTYSTYGYILRHLQAQWPHLDVITVPGITSYQAAAAAVNRPLVEGEESLLIMSGVHGGERFQRMPVKPDNVVFLKAYRNVEGICTSLEAADMLSGGVAVANCSRQDEQIYRDLNLLKHQRPNYWTLIMARKKHDASEEN